MFDELIPKIEHISAQAQELCTHYENGTNKSLLAILGMIPRASRSLIAQMTNYPSMTANNTQWAMWLNDIGTPLAALKGVGSLVAEYAEQENLPELTQLCDYIYETCEDIRAIIGDIRDNHRDTQ